MICPIKGAFFRPPAKAILDSLPANFALALRPEPDNAYDPHAVAVWVTLDADDLDALAAPIRDKLAPACEGYGYTLDDLAAQREWQLGYVPKELSPQVAAKLQGREHHGRLGFLAGSPAVWFEDPEP